MKRDIGSSFTTTDGLDAKSRTAATYYSTGIDHSTGKTGHHALSCGTFATSLVATLQYSDDDSTYYDDDGSTGNDYTATLTAAGRADFNVPNPMGRYTRLKVVLGGTCVIAVISQVGPLDYVAAA
jgi:hypothetical protein